jgi:predicted nucleotidyltransferase
MAEPPIHVSGEELGIIKSILSSILTHEEVFVFGSRARGTHRKTSDIDLAVHGSTPLSMVTRSQLEFGFSESSLPFRVDVVDLATVDKSFRELIEKDAVPLDYRN